MVAEGGTLIAVHLMGMNGESRSCSILDNTKVLQLKTDTVPRVLGLPQAHIAKLTLHDRILDDTQSLKEQGVISGTTLSVVVELQEHLGSEIDSARSDYQLMFHYALRRFEGHVLGISVDAQEGHWYVSNVQRYGLVPERNQRIKGMEAGSMITKRTLEKGDRLIAVNGMSSKSGIRQELQNKADAWMHILVGRPRTPISSVQNEDVEGAELVRQAPTQVGGTADSMVVKSSPSSNKSDENSSTQSWVTVEEPESVHTCTDPQDFTKFDRVADQLEFKSPASLTDPQTAPAVVAQPLAWKGRVTCLYDGNEPEGGYLALPTLEAEVVVYFQPEQATEGCQFPWYVYGFLQEDPSQQGWFPYECVTHFRKAQPRNRRRTRNHQV